MTLKRDIEHEEVMAELDLLKYAKVLAKELSSKKFPRNQRNAYLSCFLNIGTIDDFLKAVEKGKKHARKA